MKHLKTYEGILDIFKNKPKQHFPYPNDSDKQYWRQISITNDDLLLKYSRFFSDTDTNTMYFVFNSYETLKNI